MLRKTFLFLILGLCSLTGIAQNKTASVQQLVSGWQTIPEMANAGIGMAISDSGTGEILLRSEPQLSLVPASVLKIVTTATALEVFGPYFRFKTVLSYSGEIRNDTLFGDLRIIGGGDPTLGSHYFPENNHFLEEWTQAIEHRHIKMIVGNLIADAGIYESQTIPDTWVWEDIGNYFGAGASGISVYDNLYEIHLSSGNTIGQPTKVSGINPEIPNLELQNEVISSDINRDLAYVFGSPLDNKRIIRGTIPKNKSDFVVKGSVPNPAALLANEFRKKLATHGIEISGETSFEKTSPSGNVLFVNQSPPLKEIIKVTNHESVNLFAEHLLKHLAFQEHGLGTTKGGCKFISQFWKEKGMDPAGFFTTDGSGLSRFNAITASQLVYILNYMRLKSKYAGYFYESLASPGNGTLTVFNSEYFPDHCLRAKSGSMTRVRCYAGYLTTNSGRQLSFVVMLNNFSCSQTEAIRKIEEALIELRKM